MAVPHAPSRWKRLLYSVLSILLSAFIVSFISSLLHSRRLPFGAISYEAFAFTLFILVPCVPGWLLALPVILGVTDFTRWRFFAFWAIGTALGPLVMLGIAVVFYLESSRAATFFFPAGMAWFATGVAGLATLFYLLLVRRHQRRARWRDAGGAS